MPKTKMFDIVMIIVGSLLLVAAVAGSLLFSVPKMAAGIAVGISTVLLGIALPGLLIKICETSQPAMMKQNRIEYHDERNTMIRNKAKAKVSDITQWFMMGVFYVAILLEAPQWLFFSLAGVYLLKNILEVVLHLKYQREM